MGPICTEMWCIPPDQPYCYEWSGNTGPTVCPEYGGDDPFELEKCDNDEDCTISHMVCGSVRYGDEVLNHCVAENMCG